MGYTLRSEYASDKLLLSIKSIREGIAWLKMSSHFQNETRYYMVMEILKNKIKETTNQTHKSTTQSLILGFISRVSGIGHPMIGCPRGHLLRSKGPGK